MLLQDQVCIVTGASRGIGRAIALDMARAGARLVITGSSVSHLDGVAEEVRATGAGVRAVAGDITDPRLPEHLVEEALRTWGKVHGLVNNAGAMLRMPTAELTDNDWNRLLDVNLNAAFRLCRAALAVMPAGGSVVNVASSAAKAPHPNASPAYGVSKAGLVALTRHLALEYAGRGIRVNAVCPGPVESDMTAQWSPDYRARKLAAIPLGRLGTPEDIARAVTFLASSHAAFITGECLNINGGTLMD